MDLHNEFSVGLPIERAWALLTDVERIAPCMPGAQLTGVEGETYTGLVKVKLGPVLAQYGGTAVFERKDDAAHVAVLRAAGRDSHGQGNASALVTATLVPDGERTAVSVHTDLTITGKVAQFGRGVIIDVSGKLLQQFVDCLESSLVADLGHDHEPQPAAVAEQAPEHVPERVPAAVSEPAPRPMQEVAPVDLMAVARGPVLKRAAPLFGLVAIVVVALACRRHLGSAEPRRGKP